MLAEHDIERLCSHLGLVRQEFLDKYAEFYGGKYRLQVGEDDYCVFFREGCVVQDHKPDICRAWPFFRGNIEDAYSWDMAKECCPGIMDNVPHRVFAAQGRAFLKSEGLLRGKDDDCADALRFMDE